MNKYLELEYPYYNLYYDFNKKKILSEIKNFEPIVYTKIPKELEKSNIKKYESTYFLIKDVFTQTQNINNITDYFSEKVRITCQIGNKVLPKKYWQNNKKQILDNTLKRYETLTIPNIREIIYKNTKLCNNFRITVALTILKFFQPKKWLDISAGWGDRLLAAIFYKNIQLYTATDPNLDMHPCYDDMINTLVPASKRKNFIIHKNGFLEANIVGVYDIVFSSPPFFTLEKYSNYKEDSVTQFSNENDWINNFLVKALLKAYKHLKQNGYMILYWGGSNIVMDKMFSTLKHMKYNGVIYFYEKRPRGIHVWQKI